MKTFFSSERSLLQSLSGQTLDTGQAGPNTFGANSLSPPRRALRTRLQGGVGLTPNQVPLYSRSLLLSRLATVTYCTTIAEAIG